MFDLFPLALLGAPLVDGLRQGQQQAVDEDAPRRHFSSAVPLLKRTRNCLTTLPCHCSSSNFLQTPQPRLWAAAAER